MTYATDIDEYERHLKESLQYDDWKGADRSLEALGHIMLDALLNAAPEDATRVRQIIATTFTKLVADRGIVPRLDDVSLVYKAEMLQLIASLMHQSLLVQKQQSPSEASPGITDNRVRDLAPASDNELKQMKARDREWRAILNGLLAGIHDAGLPMLPALEDALTRARRELGTAATPCSDTAVPNIFDFLETVADEIENRGDRFTANQLRAGFARATGGVDLDYLVDRFAHAARDKR